MTFVIQTMLNGVMLGSTYALMALGLTLIYGILNIPNFAHGHLYMFGAYIAFFLMTVCGVSYWLATVISIIALAIVGLVVERLVYHPLRSTPHVNSFIAAVGLLIFLESLALILWGGQYRHMPPVPLEQVLSIGGVTITAQRLLVIGSTILLIVLLQLLIKKTTIGSTIEAVAQDREGALLMGINVGRVTSLTFAIGTALAAAAAVLYCPLSLLSPGMGGVLVVKAFAIIILGGLGSIPGAIAGGFILGPVESFGGAYVSTAFKDVFAFALLIIILIAKPSGLFGEKRP